MRPPTKWAVAVGVVICCCFCCCCVGDDELDDVLDDDDDDDEEEDEDDDDDEEEEDDDEEPPPINEADDETPLDEELGDGDGVDGVGEPRVMVAPLVAPIPDGLPAGLPLWWCCSCCCCCWIAAGEIAGMLLPLPFLIVMIPMAGVSVVVVAPPVWLPLSLLLMLLMLPAAAVAPAADVAAGVAFDLFITVVSCPVAQALPASYRIRVPLRPLAAVGGAGVVVVARQTALSACGMLC